jgi:translation initiation factor IF-3
MKREIDVVEVNPNSDPPVAKLIDYGKYKYEQKKKAQEAKKKQTVVNIKEVQFRPKIDKHDFDFKIKHIERFIEEGNKVKVCIVFRGRELAHPEMADSVIENIKEAIKEIATIENVPKLEGRRMIMQLCPVKKP